MIGVVRLTLLIKGDSDARMTERACGLWRCRLINKCLFAHVSCRTSPVSTSPKRRWDRSAADRVDGGDPEKHEQDVWAVFACGSAGGRTEGGRTEGSQAPPAQSLHRQREYSCSPAQQGLRGSARGLGKVTGGLWGGDVILAW